ncbi:hypothetical protein HDU81_004276 [Chytriomyces hyalinus]|nr:hypothetical protein HDU81_004276 [Chytriomyces hyalinus]
MSTTLETATSSQTPTSTPVNVCAFVECIEPEKALQTTNSKTPKVVLLRDNTRSGVALKTWSDAFAGLRSGDLLRFVAVKKVFMGTASLQLVRQTETEDYAGMGREWMDSGGVVIVSRLAGDGGEGCGFGAGNDEFRDRIESLLAWSVSDPFLSSLRLHSASEVTDSTNDRSRRSAGSKPIRHSPTSTGAANSSVSTIGSLKVCNATLSSTMAPDFCEADEFNLQVTQSHAVTQHSIRRDALEQALDFSLLGPEDLFARLRWADRLLQRVRLVESFQVEVQSNAHGRIVSVASDIDNKGTNAAVCVYCFLVSRQNIPTSQLHSQQLPHPKNCFHSQ